MFNCLSINSDFLKFKCIFILVSDLKCKEELQLLIDSYRRTASFERQNNIHTDRQIDRQRKKEDGQIKSILTNVRPKIKISRSRQTKTFLNFNLNKSKEFIKEIIKSVWQLLHIGEAATIGVSKSTICCATTFLSVA